jgi:Fe-S-cluster containining protein
MEFTYPENINFECNRCGLCCGDTKKKTRHILVLAEEARRIAEYVCHPIENFAEATGEIKPYIYQIKKSTKGKCFFLDNNQCTIYNLRPLICRFYPFELKFSKGQGSYVFDFTFECPTIGKGKNLTREDFKDLFIMAKEKLG